jgi:hypothetical protein
MGICFYITISYQLLENEVCINGGGIVWLFAGNDPR